MVAKRCRRLGLLIDAPHSLKRSDVEGARWNARHQTKLESSAYSVRETLVFAHKQVATIAKSTACSM